MKKRRLTLLILLLVVGMALGSCAPGTASVGEDGSSGFSGGHEEKTVTYDTYGSYWMRPHDDKTMPVGAFNSCPDLTGAYTYSYIKNKQTFKDYAEAGVNVMMGLYEYTASEEVYQALEWCGEYGLAYLVKYAGADNTNKSTARATLSQAKYYDAFAGVMQVDEPGRVSFEKIARSAEIITEVLPEEYADKCLMHVNLFPDYATQYQLYNRVNSGELPEGGYSYTQYVEDFLEIVDPKILSYDNYPVSGGENVLKGYSYFGNMALIRKYALQKNIPFWTYVQTCSFGGSSRVPNEAELLWQVNTALSYGAKGLQYFCGVNPIDGGETFKGSMFDRDGNKTEVYSYVKKAGVQIGAADEVLMHSISKGVMITGDVPYDSARGTGIPEADVLQSYGELVSVTGKHVFTGCFDYDGKSAYYITNNSITEDDEILLKFNKSVKGFTVFRGVKTPCEGAELSVSLNAGEGVLIVIES